MYVHVYVCVRAKQINQSFRNETEKKQSSNRNDRWMNEEFKTIFRSIEIGELFDSYIIPEKNPKHTYTHIYPIAKFGYIQTRTTTTTTTKVAIYSPKKS